MLVEMDALQWLWIGLIMFVASVIQGSIGFAFAIFAIPLLMLVGLPLHETIAVICVGSTLQCAQGFWSLRKSIDRQTVMFPFGLRLVGLLIGVSILVYFTTLPIDTVKIGTGWLILALLAFQIWSEGLEGLRFNKPSSYALFLTSGIMAGMIGIGGPPLVIWSMAQQDWSPQKIRAFLYSQFALSIPIQLVIMVYQFGLGLLTTIGYTLLFIPFIFLGTKCGLVLGNKLSKQKLKIIAYLVLFLIGAKLIFG